MFLKNLNGGLDIPVVLSTYSPGNNCSNLHSVWKYNDKDPIEIIFTKSIPVVEIIKPLLPQYHTRAAQEQDIKAMWNALSGITNSIPAPEDQNKKSDLEKAPSIAKCLEHCTRQRHYFFEIMKCGKEICGICNLFTSRGKYSN